MTPFALSAIKYAILALLYLFIWRALRSTVKGAKTAAPAGRGGGGRNRSTDAAGPAPPELSTVIVHGPDGAKPRTFKLAASMAAGTPFPETSATQNPKRLSGS